MVQVFSFYLGADWYQYRVSHFTDGKTEYSEVVAFRAGKSASDSLQRTPLFMSSVAVGGLECSVWGAVDFRPSRIPLGSPGRTLAWPCFLWRHLVMAFGSDGP